VSDEEWIRRTAAHVPIHPERLALIRGRVTGAASGGSAGAASGGRTAAASGGHVGAASGGHAMASSGRAATTGGAAGASGGPAALNMAPPARGSSPSVEAAPATAAGATAFGADRLTRNSAAAGESPPRTDLLLPFSRPLPHPTSSTSAPLQRTAPPVYRSTLLALPPDFSFAPLIPPTTILPQATSLPPHLPHLLPTRRRPLTQQTLALPPCPHFQVPPPPKSATSPSPHPPALPPPPSPLPPQHLQPPPHDHHQHEPPPLPPSLLSIPGPPSAPRRDEITTAAAATRPASTATAPAAIPHPPFSALEFRFFLRPKARRDHHHHRRRSRRSACSSKVEEAPPQGWRRRSREETHGASLPPATATSHRGSHRLLTSRPFFSYTGDYFSTEKYFHSENYCRTKNYFCIGLPSHHSESYCLPNPWTWTICLADLNMVLACWAKYGTGHADLIWYFGAHSGEANARSVSPFARESGLSEGREG
jgi:hypothetical protein